MCIDTKQPEMMKRVLFALFLFHILFINVVNRMFNTKMMKLINNVIYESTRIQFKLILVDNLQPIEFQHESV